MVNAIADYLIKLFKVFTLQKLNLGSHHFLIPADGRTRLSIGRRKAMYLAGRFVYKGQHNIEGNVMGSQHSFCDSVQMISKIVTENGRQMQITTARRIHFPHIIANTAGYLTQKIDVAVALDKKRYLLYI
jgi:hypothetical protein